jgi:hypothetical protein
MRPSRQRYQYLEGDACEMMTGDCKAADFALSTKYLARSILPAFFPSFLPLPLLEVECRINLRIPRNRFERPKIAAAHLLRLQYITDSYQKEAATAGISRFRDAQSKCKNRPTISLATDVPCRQIDIYNKANLARTRSSLTALAL